MKKKNLNSNKYHILCYVLNCETHMKRFKNLEEMGVFIDKFVKKYPDYMSTDSDNWIDWAITDISGEVHFFTDGIKLK